MRVLLLLLVSCTSSKEPARVESLPVPVVQDAAIVDSTVDVAGVQDAAPDAAPPLPKSVYPIRSISPDGTNSLLEIGVGKRDGVTTEWRLRLVKKDGTVEPDHELVIVRVDDRRLVARTKFPAPIVRDTYDRVDAQPR